MRMMKMRYDEKVEDGAEELRDIEKTNANVRAEKGV